MNDYDNEPVEQEFVLLVPCLACNREEGDQACVLCSQIERAERATGFASPQLAVAER